MSELSCCFLNRRLSGKARLTEPIDPKHGPQTLCLDRPTDSLASRLQCEPGVALRASLTPRMCVLGQEASHCLLVLQDRREQPPTASGRHRHMLRSSSPLLVVGTESRIRRKNRHVATPGFPGKTMLPSQATSAETGRETLASTGQLLPPACR